MADRAEAPRCIRSTVAATRRAGLGVPGVADTRDAPDLGPHARALAAPGNRLSALREYERLRLPRANQVVRSGPRIARTTTTSNPLIGALRTGAIRLIPRRMLIAAFSSRRDATKGRRFAATEGTENTKTS